MPSISQIRKIIISLFIILNIGTVLFMNRPNPFIGAINGVINSFDSSAIKYKTTLCSWYIKTYAHIVGLDNRWQMFGKQSRYNWWYLIKAKYANSEIITLPLPRQSPRNWIQSFLIDFKEGKLDLNMYSNQAKRESYSRYLCRQYSHLSGIPIKSIIFELHYQYVFPPKEAIKQRKYLHPTIASRVLNEFKCPRVKEQSND